MYTRCPNCKTELSFKAPDNAQYLPDGYRHRIICPCCGLKIGVRIPKPQIIARAIEVPMARPVVVQDHVESVATDELSYAITPIVENTPAVDVEPEQKDSTPIRVDDVVESNEHSLYEPMVLEKKKSGIGRNIVIMLLSLIFVALSTCAYLVNQGVIPSPSGFVWVARLGVLDGISVWEMVINSHDSLGALFESDFVVGLMVILPLILFTLAGINFIVAFISACGKKYGRVWNLISGVILAGCAITMLFADYITGLRLTSSSIGFGDYFMEIIIGHQFYFLIVCAGVGVLQLFFSLVFLAPLKRKQVV